MEDYKPNSYRFKQEQKEAAKATEKKKVTKVINGKATVKKKKGISNITNGFISDEAANVGSYILTELVMPTVKQTIVDAIRNGAEMIFLGKVSGGRRSSSGSSYVSYDRYSNRGGSRDYERREPRESYNSGDIVFDNRVDAEAVLEQMDDIMEEYGLVRVADLYDLADINAPYTANKYGWTSIRTAEIVHVRDGYIIKLPRAIPI